jgi:subtilase family serine protease
MVDDLHCPFFYDKNVYDALARLAVQGQALFVASGDFGSYNETTGSADFPPADHPLVTSVGGIQLVTSGPGGASRTSKCR